MVHVYILHAYMVYVLALKMSQVHHVSFVLVKLVESKSLDLKFVFVQSIVSNIKLIKQEITVCYAL